MVHKAYVCASVHAHLMQAWPVTALSQQFAVQLYVRKMSICLLDIQDSINSGSLEQLQRFSLELSGLFVSFWIANPQHIAMLHSVNMQTGQVFQEAAPENLHKDLLVCNADVLCFSRCFFKICPLAKD